MSTSAADRFSVLLKQIRSDMIGTRNRTERGNSRPVSVCDVRRGQRLALSVRRSDSKNEGEIMNSKRFAGPARRERAAVYLLTGLALGYGTTALSQEPATAPEEAETIVVTGTRIARDVT